MNVSVATRIPPHPSQVAVPAIDWGMRRSASLDTATSPPSASSHARVNGEKNAPEGFAAVNAIENTKDPRNVAPSRSPIRIRTDDRVNRRRHNQEQRGVDDVELLLDREGPEVLQERRWLLGRQIVRTGCGKMEVGEKDRGPLSVDCGLAPGGRTEEEVGTDDGDDDHQRGGRDDRPDRRP